MRNDLMKELWLAQIGMSKAAKNYRKYGNVDQGENFRKEIK